MIEYAEYRKNLKALEEKIIQDTDWSCRVHNRGRHLIPVIERLNPKDNHYLSNNDIYLIRYQLSRVYDFQAEYREEGDDSIMNGACNTIKYALANNNLHIPLIRIILLKQYPEKLSTLIMKKLLPYKEKYNLKEQFSVIANCFYYYINFSFENRVRLMEAIKIVLNKSDSEYKDENCFMADICKTLELNFPEYIDGSVEQKYGILHYNQYNNFVLSIKPHDDRYMSLRHDRHTLRDNYFKEREQEIDTKYSNRIENDVDTDFTETTFDIIYCVMAILAIIIFIRF